MDLMRWIRWAYHLDKTKVGTTEQVHKDDARIAVDEGRAVYVDPPAAPTPAKPTRPTLTTTNEAAKPDAA